jgi:hypothetical protein
VQENWERSKICKKENMIFCACGCGKEIEETDKYGRPHFYISGHNGRKYSDPGQYKREWNHRNREARQKAKKRHGYKKRVELILLKGGQCSNPECKIKYDGKNASIFDFHHIRGERKFWLGLTAFMRYGWKDILEEAEKCDLLCANCHRMKTSGEY